VPVAAKLALHIFQNVDIKTFEQRRPEFVVRLRNENVADFFEYFFLLAGDSLGQIRSKLLFEFL
jgi:hypothetical protein